MMFTQRSLEHEWFYSKCIWRIFNQNSLEDCPHTFKGFPVLLAPHSKTRTLLDAKKEVSICFLKLNCIHTRREAKNKILVYISWYFCLLFLMYPTTWNIQKLVEIAWLMMPQSLEIKAKIRPIIIPDCPRPNPQYLRKIWRLIYSKQHRECFSFMFPYIYFTFFS